MDTPSQGLPGCAPDWSKAGLHLPSGERVADQNDEVKMGSKCTLVTLHEIFFRINSRFFTVDLSRVLDSSPWTYVK